MINVFQVNIDKDIKDYLVDVPNLESQKKSQETIQSTQQQEQDLSKNPIQSTTLENTTQNFSQGSIQENFTQSGQPSQGSQLSIQTNGFQTNQTEKQEIQNSFSPKDKSQQQDIKEQDMDIEFEAPTTTAISLDTSSTESKALTTRPDPTFGHSETCTIPAHATVNTRVNNVENVVSLWIKGSRQPVFNEQFPDILYTLTWKHKYDMRILSKRDIFSGKEQQKLMDQISLNLVLSETNQIPVYDKGKTKRRRPQNTRKKQKKPNQTETITVSSLSKASDNEVIIRFGINSTYCSKRFGYSAFKICVQFNPDDTPEENHFTIFSPSFKTFVKKNANITKYLQYPKPLYPEKTSPDIKKEEIKQITKTTPKKKTPRKTTRKRKRSKDYKDETTEEEVEEPKEKQPKTTQTTTTTQSTSQTTTSQTNQQSPMLPPIFTNASLLQYNLLSNVKTPTGSGVAWFGAPIGVNANGDSFYLAFYKDGIIYKLNDFVYLAPEGDTSGSEANYWISKIINLVETKNEGMRLIGQWFYRWCDVQGFGGGVDNCGRITKKQYILNKDKEVFVSFDINYNALSSVRGKCYVRYLDKEAQRKEQDWLSKKDHYFFCSGFNRVKGELFELPEQVLKILKETTNEEDDVPGNVVNGAKQNRPVTRQMVKPSDVNIKVPEWRPAPQHNETQSSNAPLTSEEEMTDDSVYEKLHQPREQMEKEKRLTLNASK